MISCFKPIVCLLLLQSIAVVSFTHSHGGRARSATPSRLESTVEAPLTSITDASAKEVTVASAKEEKDSPLRISDRTEEDTKFPYCDSSVAQWRVFVSQGDEENLNLLRQRTLEKLSDCAQKPFDRAYWSSSALRSIFFSANALGGNFWAGKNSVASEVEIPFRLCEVLQCYQQEIRYVKEGQLKFPWDFAAQPDQGIQFSHRQLNPFYYLPQSARLWQETAAILQRRRDLKGKPSAIKPPQSNNDIYPNYYLNDFHYQTDGWLSAESAERYEPSSEAIFIGSQDVMQRQTILPMVINHGKDIPTPPRDILEVACGTGRMATFVRDQFPAADYTLTDLSPFYLEKAKENDKYWRSYRGKKALEETRGGNRRGAIDDSLTPAKAVQANAEDLPFPNESFDAVVCVYLFHELPAPARRRAAAEMARVLRPGGRVVFSDSMQAGDRNAYPGQMLKIFQYINEPHYGSYLYDDLVAYFTDAGLDCESKYVMSHTKTFSFTKPVFKQKKFN